MNISNSSIYSDQSLPERLLEKKKIQIMSSLEDFHHRTQMPDHDHFILYRWNILSNLYPLDSDRCIFTVELLSLNRLLVEHRIWETKGGKLLSDAEFEPSHENMKEYKILGPFWADWWQDLFGDALDQKINVPLDICVNVGIKSFPFQFKKTWVRAGFFKLRFSNDGNIAGFEFKLSVELQDPARMYKMGWLLFCTWDLASAELVQHQEDISKIIDTLTFPRSGWEEMIVFARDELIKKGQIIGAPDWVADCYIPMHADYYQTAGIACEMDVLMMTQNFLTKPIRMTVIKHGKGFHLLNAKNIVNEDSALPGYIERNGIKIEKFQFFNERACSLHNDYLKRIVEKRVDKFHHAFKLHIVKEVQCRVVRNPKLKLFEKFEYKFNIILKSGAGEYTDEWTVFRDANEMLEYKFTTQERMPVLQPKSNIEIADSRNKTLTRAGESSIYGSSLNINDSRKNLKDSTKKEIPHIELHIPRYLRAYSEYSEIELDEDDLIKKSTVRSTSNLSKQKSIKFNMSGEMPDTSLFNQQNKQNLQTSILKMTNTPKLVVTKPPISETSMSSNGSENRKDPEDQKSFSIKF